MTNRIGGLTGKLLVAEHDAMCRKLLKAVLSRLGTLDVEPIVALTAAVMEGSEQTCMRAGMAGFLGNPLDREHLRTALERWRPGPGFVSDAVELEPPGEAPRR
jgi:hypothetical protein